MEKVIDIDNITEVMIKNICQISKEKYFNEIKRHTLNIGILISTPDSELKKYLAIHADGRIYVQVVKEDFNPEPINTIPIVEYLKKEGIIK